jgi:hypothetical protein
VAAVEVKVGKALDLMRRALAVGSRELVDALVWRALARRTAGGVALAIAGFLLAPAPGTLSSATLAADEPSPRKQEFRVARAGNPIMLPVEIGQARYRFLFDTGSTFTSVDVSLRHLLGNPTRTELLCTPIDQNPIEADLLQAPRLSLGGRPLEGVDEVLCLDYRARGLVIDGHAPDGWLGMDAVGDMVVQVDFDRGVLSLLPSVPEDAGQPLPLVYVHGGPCVPVQAGGDLIEYEEVPRFEIDTGDLAHRSGTLNRVLFGALDRAGTLYDFAESTHATIIGTTKLNNARLTSLKIGNFEQRGLIFAEGAQNSLTLNYLSRYRVIFDFPGKRLFLSPGERYADRDRRDLSGLSLRTDNGKMVIKSVKQASAAEVAGMRAGDLIVTVDGISATKLSLLDLQRMFATPSVRSIAVRRVNTIHWVRLALLAQPKVGPVVQEYILDADGQFRPVHKVR